MPTHSLDACLRLVADCHRRRIIHHLRHEATGTTTVDELVDQFHSGSDSKDGPPQDREALTIQLHHVHLPKLAEHGVVEFDHRSGAVRYRPDEQVETVLDSLSGGVQMPNR